MADTCSTCRAWAPFDDNKLGECRINSPSSGGPKARGFWPTTLYSEWCMKHLTKDGAYVGKHPDSGCASSTEAAFAEMPSDGPAIPSEPGKVG